MEQQNIPWGPVAVAALAVVVLNLIGMLWLGVSQERLRAEVADLFRQVRETPSAAPAPVDPSPELKAMREALAKLAVKVDNLAANTDDAKAVSRLTVEVKNLASRVESLAAAKTAPARDNRPAQRRPAEQEVSPRPFFGPGYPNWPVY